MPKFLVVGGIALVLGGAVLAGPASAHHSYAMFDNTTTLTVKATVVKWEWTNPHSFLDCVIDGQSWSLESASPGMLRRAGAGRDSFKPGDVVTVVIHPRRDKSLGGQVLSITSADGHLYPFDAARQQLQQ
jgi:hypothetical protein